MYTGYIAAVIDTDTTYYEIFKDRKKVKWRPLYGKPDDVTLGQSYHLKISERKS
jgi:hypothetical protein